MRSLFGGRRRSRFSLGKELGRYRNEVSERAGRIDALLSRTADVIDALRRRDVEADEAVDLLDSAERSLDLVVEELRGMHAPEELHGLHMEYEANLERALRGIATAERGCAITRMPHRPRDDEEVFTHYKRGHLNVVHARMRMGEIVDTLLAWEPGRPATATVASRLHREGGHQG